MTKPPPNCVRRRAARPQRRRPQRQAMRAEPCPPRRSWSSSGYGCRSAGREPTAAPTAASGRGRSSREPARRRPRRPRVPLTSRSSTSTSQSRSSTTTTRRAAASARPRVRIRRRAADAHAAHRLRRARGLARYRAARPALTSTPSTASRYWDERAYYAFTLEQIERDIEAPTAELEGMCRELVARAIDDERMMQRAADSAAVLELDRGKLQARRPEPLWPLRPALRRARARPSCWNTTPTRRPRCSRPACSSGSGWRTRSQRKVAAEGCRPVQFAARAPDRRLEGDRQGPAVCISPA